jgi:hypothetical protein
MKAYWGRPLSKFLSRFRLLGHGADVAGGSWPSADVLLTDPELPVGLITEELASGSSTPARVPVMEDQGMIAACWTCRLP